MAATAPASWGRPDGTITLAPHAGVLCVEFPPVVLGFGIATAAVAAGGIRASDAGTEFEAEFLYEPLLLSQKWSRAQGVRMERGEDGEFCAALRLNDNALIV
jgi:hypothetical protein